MFLLLFVAAIHELLVVCLWIGNFSVIGICEGCWNLFFCSYFVINVMACMPIIAFSAFDEMILYSLTCCSRNIHVLMLNFICFVSLPLYISAP